MRCTTVLPETTSYNYAKKLSVRKLYGLRQEMS
jgi:hypothetical protein